jgi:Flp pilus assembly protein TadG
VRAIKGLFGYRAGTALVRFWSDCSGTVLVRAIKGLFDYRAGTALVRFWFDCSGAVLVRARCASD